MKKYLIILSIFLNPSFSAETDALSQRSLTTTRLQSTAGTGVGSLLMDESVILNPASIAFFQITNFYYQRNSSELQSNNTNVLSSDSDSSNLFILSDANGPLKGSALFEELKHNDIKKTSFGGSLAAPISKNSSFGISYLRTNYKNFESEESPNRVIVGVSHVISEDLTTGLTITNPLSDKKERQSIAAGIQYYYQDFITIMLDIGTKYRLKMDDKFKYSIATQFKIFQDFFLKFGSFRDQGENKKGNGIGVLWAQPKLSFGFSVNNSENIQETASGSVYNNKETSFSVAYRF